MRSIDNAAKAMEDLLLERGGLGSVRRILDQFFDRPIIRTAMSDDLRQRAQPHDQKRNTRAPHFTPPHWLLCHMGLY